MTAATKLAVTAALTLGTAAALPEAPALRLAPTPEPALTLVPWEQIRPSAGNPRQTFQDESLTELAVDIYHKGLLQNLVLRPDPREEGAFEIVAGERRWRAVGLLVAGLDVVGESGSVTLKVDPSYAMRALIRPLTDTQMLEIAIAENAQREDVDPLEEADAYVRLYGLGISPDVIAARSGKDTRYVEQRLTLGCGLSQEGRRLYAAGTLDLAQAQVIAQTSGELKRHLLKLVKDNPRLYPAAELRKLTTQERLLVSNALFDVAASGLKVVEDLWQLTPAYFRDSGAALCAQLDAVQQQADVDRQSGEWAFVDVTLSPHGHVQSLPWQTYQQAYGQAQGRGVVYLYSAQGETRRFEGVLRVEEVKQAEKERQQQARAAARAEQGPQATPVKDAAHALGQVSRARALRGALATDPRRCLALTVQGLFETASEVSVKVAHAPRVGDALPEVVALVQGWTARWPELFTSHTPGTMVTNLRGPALHDALLALSVDELLSLLAYQTHDQLDHPTSVTARPRPLARHVAQATGAQERLAQDWTVTPEFLNAHTIPQLTALVETMPEAARPAVAGNLGKKELIARILERAQALHDARWVPALIAF